MRRSLSLYFLYTLYSTDSRYCAIYSKAMKEFTYNLKPFIYKCHNNKLYKYVLWLLFQFYSTTNNT